MGKRYYPQTQSEECKYGVKKIKNVISEELNLDKSDDDYKEYDESHEKIWCGLRRYIFILIDSIMYDQSIAYT